MVAKPKRKTEKPWEPHKLPLDRIYRSPRPPRDGLGTSRLTDYQEVVTRKKLGAAGARSLDVGNMRNRARFFLSAYNSTLRDEAIAAAPAFIEALKKLQARRTKSEDSWEAAYIGDLVKAMEAWQKAAIRHAGTPQGSLLPLGLSTKAALDAVADDARAS
jgi:hypothetical protein